VPLLRWLVAGLLAWGLFAGIAYMLVPVLADGWGNAVTLAIGFVLIGVCGGVLLRSDPRSSRF
jgi:hypothetical protein